MRGLLPAAATQCDEQHAQHQGGSAGIGPFALVDHEARRRIGKISGSLTYPERTYEDEDRAGDQERKLHCLLHLLIVFTLYTRNNAPGL